MIREDVLLSQFPPDVPVDAGPIARSVAAAGRILVVLDDDPTGTQSVADLPVLTRWDLEDFIWAFGHRSNGQPAPAVYVLTNTRSLDPTEAAERNREVVRNALAASRQTGDDIGFVSRSDSTLRGHFPLEPDTIARTVAAEGGGTTDGIVIVPAFPDAGRVTIGGVHYMRGDGGSLTPVAETEFARDATFGFTSSALAGYVQEKTAGRVRAGDVIVLDLALLRTGTVEDSAQNIAAALESATDATPIAVDAASENDLRRLALGLAESERRGKRLLYRVGPPFVRARIGQEVHAELEAGGIFRTGAPRTGGLIVVGSHVGMTSRQLAILHAEHRSAHTVELDVLKLLGPDADNHLGACVASVVAHLSQSDVIVHTSRLLVHAASPAESLRIARTVSAAVVALVQETLKAAPPRFVIAKGGITSSDVAAHGLQIRHAMVRGPMLPGIVSLWEPVDGPAAGIPYVVFAGNVGDDASLSAVTRKLSCTFESQEPS